jgi:hypothetical protein
MNEFDIGLIQIACRNITEAENKLNEVFRQGDLRSDERRKILSVYERIGTQKMKLIEIVEENNKTADVWRN